MDKRNTILDLLFINYFILILVLKYFIQGIFYKVVETDK